MDANSDTYQNFITKFGDSKYIFKLTMANDSGDYVSLNRNKVLYLEINDSLFNPFHTATLIINDDNNSLENMEQPFVFTGNGRDFVNVLIYPTFSNDLSKDLQDEKLKEMLMLRFSFIVIEVNELYYNRVKAKKITLIQNQQYSMGENIFNMFSLQKAGVVAANYMENNAGNAVATGVIIKGILEHVFPDVGDIIDKDEHGEIFESDGDSMLNLNPYGVLSYDEVLNYVLQFHTFKKSPCVLQLDRYKEKFSLISLKTLFEKHADKVMETLVLPSIDNKDKNDQSKPTITWKTAPIIFDESKIIEFFSEPGFAKYNINMTGNASVTSTNRSTKSMVFNSKSLHSEEFTNVYYKLFVEPFKDLFSNPNEGFIYEVFPNFYPSPNEKNKYNNFKEYLPPHLSEKKFLNQKLSTLLYLNNSYKFNLIGKTHRRSLSFVDVKAPARGWTYKPTRWDLNNIGRHLVTNVKHIFSHNSYMNEVETIKPYRLVDKTQNPNMTLEEFLNKGI